jgi:hypothetical protein
MITIRFAVDQNKIGLDVTIAVIGPFTRKRMIEIAGRQRGVGSKQIDEFHQGGVKRFAVPP